MRAVLTVSKMLFSVAFDSGSRETCGAGRVFVRSRGGRGVCVIRVLGSIEMRAEQRYEQGNGQATAMSREFGALGTTCGVSFAALSAAVLALRASVCVSTFAFDSGESEFSCEGGLTKGSEWGQSGVGRWGGKRGEQG